MGSAYSGGASRALASATYGLRPPPTCRPKDSLLCKVSAEDDDEGATPTLTGISW
jgi:hypothetical protein